jgi:hypothetical protein
VPSVLLFQLATTPVSTSLVASWESQAGLSVAPASSTESLNANVSASLVAATETLARLSLSAIDATSSAQGVSSSPSSPYEIAQSLSVSSTQPIAWSGLLSVARVDAYESAGGIQVTLTSAYEAVSVLQKALSTPYEILLGLAPTIATRYEALAQLAIASLASLEWLNGLRVTQIDAFEAQGVPLFPVSNVFTSDTESIIQLALLLDASYEALQSLVRTTASASESHLGLSVAMIERLAWRGYLSLSFTSEPFWTQLINCSFRPTDASALGLITALLSGAYEQTGLSVAQITTTFETLGYVQRMVTSAYVSLGIAILLPPYVASIDANALDAELAEV